MSDNGNDHPFCSSQKTAYAQARAAFTALRENVLIHKMSAAALERLEKSPWSELLRGIDPTLIPEVLLDSGDHAVVVVGSLSS